MDFDKVEILNNLDEMEKSFDIVECSFSNFEYEFQDKSESLAGQDELEVLNLGSSTSETIDNLSMNFNRENEDKQEDTLDENELSSPQQHDVSQITLDVPNFYTDVFESLTNGALDDGKTIAGNLV